jgi:Phosphate-selective porin O and P
MRGALAGIVCATGMLMAGPLFAQASDVTVRLSGRMQFQFNTTSVSSDDLGGGSSTVAGSTFETRRVRLAANVAVRDWITGIVEADFALAQLRITQAWMNLAIDPAFELRIGQFKKPFSQILLTSSLETAPIERGLRIRDLDEAYEVADEAAAGEPVLGAFRGTTLLGEEHELLEQLGYLSYDMGVAAHGRLGDVTYDLGAFNGTGADRRDENSAKSYAGRLRWHIPTTTPLLVGAAASYHEVRLSAADPAAGGTAVELDVELGGFRREGVHVIAEAVVGDNLGADETFRGAQGIVSLFRPVTGSRIDGIEPLGRISWGDPNSSIDGDEGLLLTPGINLYFQGRNRLQFNWDVFVPSGDRFETKHALRAQAQLAF